MDLNRTEVRDRRLKLVTFAGKGNEQRLGAVLGTRVVDLRLAQTDYLRCETKRTDRYSSQCFSVPENMMQFLQSGPESINALLETIRCVEDTMSHGQDLRGRSGLKVVHGLSEIHLMAPVPRPGKIICPARNFLDHLEEQREYYSGSETPLAFIKVSTAVIGPDQTIVHPKVVKQLDYEVELAVVIGKRAKNISREDAYEYVAGYTVFNDISARDVQFAEMKHGLINLGKNFDTFAPMGPCLVLKDQLDDPHDLDMELRVNGEIRQRSNTRNMIFKIPDLVHYFSRMTLEPGDIITSGTPSGVAIFRKPNPERWFLKPGDLVEAEIENIGVLRNKIQEE